MQADYLAGKLLYLHPPGDERNCIHPELKPVQNVLLFICVVLQELVVDISHYARGEAFC